jgi:hypothetical protein
MKWSAYNAGNFFFTRLRRVTIILSRNARIIGVAMYVKLGPLLKRVPADLGSKMKFAGIEIAKRLGSLPRRGMIISDRKIEPAGIDSSIGFRQALRRLGIVTAARLIQTMRETKQAIKYDLEVSKRDIKERSEQMGVDITIERRNLNETLAQQLRARTGIDCQAPTIGTLQIEHRRYYSYNFPMSPKITTNRGCLIVKGRRFNIIHVIQRN